MKYILQLLLFVTYSACAQQAMFHMHNQMPCAPLPAAAGSITGTTTVCQGVSGIAYSVVAITGATGYVWTYTGTGFTIATGSGTNSITANFSGAASGNLTVYGTNTCGNGGASTVYIVTVAAPTIANAGAAINPACGIIITTLTGNTPVVGTGAWSVVSGIAIITTPGSPTSGVTGLAANGQAILRWTISNSPCTASTSDVVITTCCVGVSSFGCGGATTMVDARDGATYNIVQIGSQCWLAQNLNYGTQVSFSSAGSQPAGKKYCYNNSAANCTTYGGLYEWATVMAGSTTCNGSATCPNCPTPVQGICPPGWHVPTHYEWTLLEKNVSGSPGSFPYDMTTTGSLGTNEGGNLKETGTTHWASPNTGATNSSGFKGLPAGQSDGSGFQFEYITQYCIWWTATASGGNAWERYVNYTGAQITRTPIPKQDGFPVRCVKN